MNKTLRLFVFFIGIFAYAYVSSQELNPESVRSYIETCLGTHVCAITQIKGGLTNTSFAATTSAGKCVARFGKNNPQILGINRFCETACQQQASELGIAPAVLFSKPQEGTLISTFIEGTTLSADQLRNKEQLQRVVEVMKKYHKMPYQQQLDDKPIFDKLRLMLSYSQQYEDSVLNKDEATAIGTFIDQAEDYFAPKEGCYAGLCHCDLFPPNFIDDGAKLWLIDWEYACWGNILFDLANLSSELDLDKNGTNTLLELYFGQEWQEHYTDFMVMLALFNLRNTLWYDLRAKEIAAIAGYSMIDYAKKHLKMFYQIIDQDFLREPLKPYIFQTT